jgi:tetratricopeptide (TPR) repeat protein
MNFIAAVSDYNMANRLDPAQTDIYYNRGLALLGLEEYEDALFDFDAALQVNPNQALVHFNRGKAQLGNNDPGGAMESLTNAVNLDGKNAAAYYLLGVTRMSALGEKKEGCADLKMAMSLGYTEAKTWIDDFCE